jgi:hypothetical protein
MSRYEPHLDAEAGKDPAFCLRAAGAGPSRAEDDFLRERLGA